ncbi:MAG TPA: zinc-ribbon domain-containing protein [Streptosporangiaceae bacterium]|nr:zinc-ribbon domain-containing protein [Streptosporangiaceae bacterium]
MLIIWGLRVFYRTIGEGTFHCRRCGGDRAYRLRMGRRFFTLFFIPLVPLNKVGEHAQCAACRTRYHADVLNLPTVAQMQAALPAGMRAAACIMLTAGDRGSELARQRAIEVITKAGADGYNEAALEADLAAAPGPGAAALSQVGAQLAIQAREWVLADVVRIGMADGPLTDAERDAAHVVGAGLGMTQAQTLGVIAITEQADASG